MLIRDRNLIKRIMGKARLSILDARIWLLIFIIQMTSLRNYYIASSIPYPSLVLVLSSVIMFIIFAHFFYSNDQSWIWKNLNAKGLTIILLIIMWGIGQFMYSRMEGLDMGGTGDDAMQQPVIAMMQRKAPYDIVLFDGAPISPGLGWILFNAPFTIFGVSSLLNGFFIGITVFLYIRFRKQTRIANMVLIATMLCFAGWEQIYSYHDLLVIGFAFMLVFLVAEHSLKSNTSAFFLGLLVGVFATSRLIFVFLPSLVGFIYYGRSKTEAIIYGVTGTTMAISLHIVGYLTNEYYQPLHLLNRGSNNIPLWVVFVGGGVSLLTLLFAQNKLKECFQSHLFWFSTLIFVPLFFISVGELMGGGCNIKNWEAARYLLPALPCILWVIFESDHNIQFWKC